jgi:A/G-specific adenine glycosylase
VSEKLPGAQVGARRLTVADPPVAAVLDWWSANGRSLPWRSTRDPYGVWVSEVMSIQTTVERAARAWTAWMRRWPTVESLAAASLADVLAQWQGLGYPRRARDLHRAATTIAAGGWPEDLTELPGVGRYVADAISCFALERATLPVDVNVARVLVRRFPGGIDIGRDPWRAGQALMEFGQVICRARPRCESCPVRDGCTGPQERPAVPRRRREPFDGSLRQRRGRLLARVLADGRVAVGEADAEAAASLIGDGLIGCAGRWLIAPQ